MTKFTHTILKKAFNVKSIVTVLYFDYSKEYRFAGESHDFWEILYVDKGELSVNTDTFKHKIKSNEMIFHKPKEFHDITASDKSSSALIISFECHSKEMKFFENKIIKTTISEKNLLSNIIKDSKVVFSALNDKPPVYGMQRKVSSPVIEQSILNSLELLLISIYRREKNITQKVSNTLKNEKNLLAIDEISNYLKQNMHRNLSLELIADELCMSVSKLKKQFEKSTKGGLINYLIELKIEKAKELILEEVYNLTEISEQLGFNSLHYFSRRFKKITGKSPTEYKNSVL